MKHTEATLFIKNLKVYCIIGNDEAQRQRKQPICIQLSLWTDITKAAQTDDLNDAVDIIKIYEEIVTMVEKSTFKLIETLSTHIAEICLRQERIQKVKVIVEKTGLLEKAERSGIEVTLEK